MPIFQKARMREAIRARNSKLLDAAMKRAEGCVSDECIRTVNAALERIVTIEKNTISINNKKVKCAKQTQVFWQHWNDTMVGLDRSLEPTKYKKIRTALECMNNVKTATFGERSDAIEVILQESLIFLNSTEFTKIKEMHENALQSFESVTTALNQKNYKEMGLKEFGREVLTQGFDDMLQDIKNCSSESWKNNLDKKMDETDEGSLTLGEYLKIVKTFNGDGCIDLLSLRRTYLFINMAKQCEYVVLNDDVPRSPSVYIDRDGDFGEVDFAYQLTPCDRKNKTLCPC